MSKSNLVIKGIDMEKLNKIGSESDKVAKVKSSLIKNIVAPITEELDNIMVHIYERVLNPNEISLPEVENYLMQLSAVMYRTEVNVEKLSILSDASKNIFEEVYSEAVRNSDGSAKDKREAEGRLKAQYESLWWDIRKAAHSISKIKINAAERQHKTLSRVITSRRMEYERTLNDGTDN